MTDLPKICCCGHAAEVHYPARCRDCTACPEYVGVGSYRALQILALSDIFRTSKINIDVQVKK